MSYKFVWNKYPEFNSLYCDFVFSITEILSETHLNGGILCLTMPFHSVFGPLHGVIFQIFRYFAK